MKKGDDVADIEDDDAVRTSMSQNQVTVYCVLSIVPQHSVYIGVPDRRRIGRVNIICM
jgi:hypothetical protein